MAGQFGGEVGIKDTSGRQLLFLNHPHTGMECGSKTQVTINPRDCNLQVSALDSLQIFL